VALELAFEQRLSAEDDDLDYLAKSSSLAKLLSSSS
jgi:hypothetical protein